MQYNPYDRYASSSSIKVDNITVEDWDCKLVEPDHPALYQRASVDPFGGSVDWSQREREMIALMHDNLGIGLAANQLGSNYNMFVMTHSVLGDIGVYKPEILESHGSAKIKEGCLTWPLLYLIVERPAEIKVRFYKSDGETQVETWMDGMDARCFLHEYDHLQGRVFLDRVSEFKLKHAKKKRDKLFKKLDRSHR